MIKICIKPGVFHPRIEHEPRARISQAQREALLKIALEDPEATFRGFDARMRPVVVMQNQHADRRTTYALLRNGTATQVHMPLHEHWEEG